MKRTHYDTHLPGTMSPLFSASVTHKLLGALALQCSLPPCMSSHSSSPFHSHVTPRFHTFCAADRSTNCSGMQSSFCCFSLYHLHRLRSLNEIMASVIFYMLLFLYIFPEHPRGVHTNTRDATLFSHLTSHFLSNWSNLTGRFMSKSGT